MAALRKKEQVQTDEQTRTRVVLLPAPEVNTVYANTFHTQFTDEEFFLTACVSQADSDREGPVLSVRPQVRLTMTIGGARRLAQALLRALEQHDQVSQSHPE